MKRWGLVLCVLLLAGCKDKGEAPFKAAKTQYEALVIKGARPADPAWDVMLTELQKVPSGSAFRPGADELEAAVQTLRQTNRPGLPLALGQKNHREGEVAAALAQCEELAKAYGAAPAAERLERMKALDACRKKAEVLDAQHAHDVAGSP